MNLASKIPNQELNLHKNLIIPNKFKIFCKSNNFTVLRLLLGEWKFLNCKICYLNCFKLVILNFTTKTAVKYEHSISDVERKLTQKHLKHINLKPEIHPRQRI